MENFLRHSYFLNNFKVNFILQVTELTVDSCYYYSYSIRNYIRYCDLTTVLFNHVYDMIIMYKSMYKKFTKIV